MGFVLDQIVREMNAGKVKENVLLVLIQHPMPLNSQFFFSLDAMYLQDNFVPSYFRPLLGTVSFLDSNGFQTFCTWKYCIGHWGVGHIYQVESMNMPTFKPYNPSSFKKIKTLAFLFLLYLFLPKNVFF